MELIRQFATDHSYAWAQWTNLAFVALVTPSVATLAWMARRSAPRMATVGALVAVTGMLAGISSGVNSDQIAWTAAQRHDDPVLIGTFADTLQDSGVPLLGSLLFILGLIIGVTLIGIALWRSRAVAPWAGGAVAVGALTHPFLQFNHVVVGIGLCVLAAGCTAASAALLRLRNDDVDLAPRRLS